MFSHISRVIQIKIILGYHYSPIIMKKLKRLTITSDNGVVVQFTIGNPHMLLMGIQDDIATMEKILTVFFLNKDKHTLYDIAILLLGI